MCLLVIAHQLSDETPLIVAGNRDEFHARPTRNARWWSDKPNVLGGRDQQAGGTWLAVHRNGRFATVTNFRDAVPPSGKLLSRGHLVTGFLESDAAPLDYLESIDGERYAGFNLLVGDGEQLAYSSNRDGGQRLLAPGIYAVANATLDTPWSKVVRSKAALAELIEAGRANETNLLRMLGDRSKARASDVKTEGLAFERAHALTAPFIVQPDYGTRCSTIVIRERGGRVRFTEARYRPDGSSDGRDDFSFALAD